MRNPDFLTREESQNQEYGLQSINHPAEVGKILEWENRIAAPDKYFAWVMPQVTNASEFPCFMMTIDASHTVIQYLFVYRPEQIEKSIPMLMSFCQRYITKFNGRNLFVRCTLEHSVSGFLHRHPEFVSKALNDED